MVMNTSGQNRAWVLSKWIDYCSSTESMVDSWRNETPHSTSEITYGPCAFITIDVNHSLPPPPPNTFHVSLSKARSYNATICHCRLWLHNGTMYFPHGKMTKRSTWQFFLMRFCNLHSTLLPFCFLLASIYRRRLQFCFLSKFKHWLY